MNKAVKKATAKDWLGAMRLRTLPLALASIGMGAFLAAFLGAFDGRIAGLCALTTVLLQVLSNLANDYGDSVHGADSANREGPQRAVQSGAIGSKAMKRAISLFVVLSLVSGLLLLWLAFQDNLRYFFIFLGLGVVAIVAAITYTASSKPYGYAGLGDVSVLLFFGFTGVLGTLFLQSQRIPLSYLLPALSCGFFAVAVLNVNNIRDIQSDKDAGKRSVPVRLGRRLAVRYHWALLLLGFSCAVAFSLVHPEGPLQWLFLLVLPLLLRNGLAIYKYEDARKLDPFLKQMALSTLLFVVLFGTGLLLAV